MKYLGPHIPDEVKNGGIHELGQEEEWNVGSNSLSNENTNFLARITTTIIPETQSDPRSKDSTPNND